MYHIIFVCKYRKPLLVKYGEFVKDAVMQIATFSKFEIEQMESDRDHLHILISASPSVSVSQIVRRLKARTTFAIWDKYGSELSQEFWKERTFWSDGYFACSVGNASEETVRKYIEEQG
jgi:putative transposase